jgi:hypothetical protein
MRSRNPDLDSFIIKLVNEDSPLGTTLRHVYYVSASAKFCPLSQKGYTAIGRVIRRLRQEEELNEDNILDGTSIWQEPYVFSSRQNSSCISKTSIRKTCGRIRTSI